MIAVALTITDIPRSMSIGLVVRGPGWGAAVGASHDLQQLKETCDRVVGLV